MDPGARGWLAGLRIELLTRHVSDIVGRGSNDPDMPAAGAPACWCSCNAPVHTASWRLQAEPGVAPHRLIPGHRGAGRSV